jgi:hypothetical protein
MDHDMSIWSLLLDCSFDRLRGVQFKSFGSSANRRVHDTMRPPASSWRVDLAAMTNGESPIGSLRV